MIRRPPRSTRTDTRFPYTTLCRSVWEVLAELVEAGELRDILRESEAVWGQARAPWMVEVNEKDEPSASVECHGLKHVHFIDGPEAMKKNALPRLRFESGQICQLTDRPVNRDGVRLSKAKWARAVRVLVVGRRRFQHHLHHWMNELQLELFVIQDAMDVRKRLT